MPPCSLCNKSLQLGIAKYGGVGGWLPYSLETEGKMYPNNESHDKKITFGSLVPISKSFKVFRGTLHTTQAASLEIQAPSGYRCLKVSEVTASDALQLSALSGGRCCPTFQPGIWKCDSFAVEDTTYR